MNGEWTSNDGTVRLFQADSLEVLPTLAPESIDSVVTDPPYGIRFMGKAWDGADIEQETERRAKLGRSTDDGRTSVVFGAASSAGIYDLSPKGTRAFQEWCYLWAAECLRVLKPGGHLLAFSGTRTYHRLASAVEDAGFEIRDQMQWLFGSGFPKSKNLSGERQGWGTALKPAHEPIVLARKPLVGTVAANVERFGTGALNIDGCRIEVTDPQYAKNCSGDRGHDENRTRSSEFGMTAGSASALGRWPANVLHDGSDEVLRHFPFTESGQPAGIKAGGQKNCYGMFAGGVPVTGFGDAGSAARFFYCPKASREDRNQGCDGMEKKPLHWSIGDQNPGSFQSDGTDKSSENFHPTVKPTELMRYLCRLVTPRAGLVLDPFMGSGSTGKACTLEGFRFVGIEREAEYFAIARARVGHEFNKTPLF